MIQRKLLITRDGSHTIFVPSIDETYHSTHGAIQESQHIFIKQGLSYYVDQNPNRPVNLFEVGFGSGLNAFLAIKFSESHEIIINYLAIEPFPLIKSEIDSLNYPGLLDKGSGQETFIEIHQAPWDTWSEITSCFKLKKINVTIQEFEVLPCNICFFDAFAPSKQPEMWEKNIFKRIYLSLSSGGILMTYSAKGQFKRDLKSLGFDVETLEGPPGKKEIVRAVKT